MKFSLKYLCPVLKPVSNLPITYVCSNQVDFGHVEQEQVIKLPILRQPIFCSFIPFLHCLPMTHIQLPKYSDIRILGYSETQCLLYGTVVLCFTLW